MILKDIKIGTRMNFGFGIVLVLLVLASGNGWWGASHIAKSIHEMLHGTNKIMSLTARARADSIELRQYEKQIFIILNDPAKVAQKKKQWNETLDRLHVRMSELDKVMILPEDIKLLKIIREEEEKYSTGVKGIISRIESGQIKSSLEADAAMDPFKVATNNMVEQMRILAGNADERVNTEGDVIETLSGEISSIILAVSIIAVMLGMVIALLLTRSVTRPLNQINQVLTEVERTGDYSKKVDYHSADEVGQTAAAFNNMMASLQSALSNTNTVIGAVAVGDFSKRITVKVNGDLAQLKQNLNSSVDTVQNTMAALVEVMNALREGNFSKQVEAHADGEFKLAIEQALQSMHVLQEMMGDVGSVMSGMAQGNLTGRVKAEGRGDLAKLKEAINSSLQELSGAMKVINHNTHQVAAAANQSSAAIGQISDGAQSQMLAIGQVATAIRQTANSVTDVSENTLAASRKSQESVKIVRDGKFKMERMIDVVNSIAANSEKINKITEVIESIANKTNLLSLNAAIEAARAGEHGKGFAVVAEEVGKLAANSASSTQEIAHLVQQAVADANRAVATVKEVAADMARIESGSVEADGMMQRISAALEQQSSAVHEINANVTNLNQIGQSNAAASEEITATVVELSRIADTTRREVEKFTV